MKFEMFNLLPLLILCHALITKAVELKTFIIKMDKSKMPSSFDDHLEWYESSLNNSSNNTATILYTYSSNILHGYSARLTPDEADLLQRQPGVLSIQEDKIYNIHTSSLWPQFVGPIGSSVFTTAHTRDVIIGVLDDPSFNSSRCNSKPQFFSKAYEASGRPINEDEKVAESCHTAALYKVCWGGGYCFSSDVIAGIQKAYQDVVDTI